jgi:hypothetical protein
MAGFIPAIHVSLLYDRTDVDARQQGVHARLRRAMPGYDEDNISGF